MQFDGSQNLLHDVHILKITHDDFIDRQTQLELPED